MAPHTHKSYYGLLSAGFLLCQAVDLNVDTGSAMFLSTGISRHQDPKEDNDDSGTAVERLQEARKRARALDGQLDGDFKGIREKLLGATGLKVDDSTSHCFTDFNHVSATTMSDGHAHNENKEHISNRHGTMATGNQLGPFIVAASLKEAGTGFAHDGSWCTCAIGAGEVPPHDVAHRQFHSKVAFYLAWVNGGSTFALVTEDGEKLACGHVTSGAPAKQVRQDNWDNLGEDTKFKGKIPMAALQCSSDAASEIEQQPKSAATAASLRTLIVAFSALGITQLAWLS